MSGFDVILGNPPFLGGQKLTGAFGQPFREFLVNVHSGGIRASADLCAYFFLVAFANLRENGHTGLIATNSIAQGNSREISLSRILEKGGSIAFASRDRPWSGDASVVVNLISIKNGKQNVPSILDGEEVKAINEYLTEPGNISWVPKALKANENKSFQGSIIVGKGFFISQKEATKVIEINPKNKDVVSRHIGGRDLNTSPLLCGSRFVINYKDMEKKKAKSYSEVFSIVEREVKPDRQRINPKTGKYKLRKPMPEKYWIYAEKRPLLYSTISDLNKVLAIAQVSRTAQVAFVDSNQVLDAKLIIFPFDDFYHFGILSSSIHVIWAIERCTTMKNDLTYTPKRLFQPFPFPQVSKLVTQFGKELDNARSIQMIENNEGLTKTYNRVHTSSDTDSGIPKLRELHRDLDIAVRDAYGWSDLDLDHGFHQTKQGVRWTIGPEAQREVLDRLLALNHERYAEEVAQGLHD